jgi:hypothetical protein
MQEKVDRVMIDEDIKRKEIVSEKEKLNAMNE